VEAHLAGVLRAWGSALACVGGCIVGVAGLPASLVRADLKTARLLAKAEPGQRRAQATAG